MIPQNIPINGRIAIIDDQIEQAKPLMRLFGKKRIPYVFYSSEVDSLPDENTAYNDLRVIFLDINLVGNSRRDNKEIKSTLIGVLNRVLSDKNFPYLIVYWSRQEDEYDGLVREIFEIEPLKNKKPISFLSASKLDYWDLDGIEKQAGDEELDQLFLKINQELSKFPVYGHLLNWENQIHISADKTLEEIFSLKSFEDDWNKDSNHIFRKLASAYSGKLLEKAEAVEQIKSAFFSLNYVFTDSVEHAIGGLTDLDYAKLEKNDVENPSILSKLNKKLLFATDSSPTNKPGIVLKLKSTTKSKTIDYDELLHDCLNLGIIRPQIVNEAKEENPAIEAKALDKKIKEGIRLIKAPIQESWSRVFLVVTPLCDYAQNKFIFNKLVRGIIIKAEHLKHINKSSEAIMISPVFSISDEEPDRVLILDFRHLFSLKQIRANSVIPMFRVRQQLLAEVQSRLSRHMNRQGILFLN